MTNATTPDHPAARGASSDEWLELVDQVLLGLDHALNNRLGALRAFAELLRDEHWRTTSAATESVHKEVARLEETTSVVRLLARPRQASETGLIVEEVMTDVVRIQSMLYDVRDTPIDFVPGPPLEPVWSERSGLIRLLSVALYKMRRMAREADTLGVVRLSTESDEEFARITLASSGPRSESAISGYAATLAHSLGAEWRLAGGGLELRLPTLKSHRARARLPNSRAAE
jgi:C4-dicarboxylate-specific signal transduction histidine kinase